VVARDFENVIRPQGGGYDLGAYEHVPSTPTPPSVVSHPQNATVIAGNAATFSVAAAGSAPLSYQWQRSTDGGGTWTGVDAGGNSYTTPPTAASDDGDRYRCVVSNGVPPDATSDAATLTVHPDTDGDGMPGWWETLYGLDPDVDDADDDLDGDGLTNLAEFEGGTDPSAPNAGGGETGLGCAAGGHGGPRCSLALLLLGLGAGVYPRNGVLRNGRAACDAGRGWNRAPEMR
jgi:hypothetical protein